MAIRKKNVIKEEEDKERKCRDWEEGEMTEETGDTFKKDESRIWRDVE